MMKRRRNGTSRPSLSITRRSRSFRPGGAKESNRRQVPAPLDVGSEEELKARAQLHKVLVWLGIKRERKALPLEVGVGGLEFEGYVREHLSNPKEQFARVHPRPPPHLS